MNQARMAFNAVDAVQGGLGLPSARLYQLLQFTQGDKALPLSRFRRPSPLIRLQFHKKNPCKVCSPCTGHTLWTLCAPTLTKIIVILALYILLMSIIDTWRNLSTPAGCIFTSMKVWYDTLPVCTPYPKNGKFIQFAEDWYFWDDGVKVWIPKGYYYNGASIPRVFWFIMGDPFAPVFWAGAGAHDWRYLTHTCTRPHADESLYQLVKQSNQGLKVKMSELKIKTIWAAVRVAGYPAWTNSAKDKKELSDLQDLITARPDAEKFIIAA